MSPERWSVVKEVFDSALACEGAAREVVLRSRCGGDEELRREVESLLSSFDEDPGFIETSAVERLTGTASLWKREQGSRGDGEGAEGQRPAPYGRLGTVRAPEARAGERLGAYRLLEVLGSGGMGTVYAAVRDDDAYRKRVAVKIVGAVALAVDARKREELLRRFRTERQLLASLDHPAIPTLLDGGTTEDGLCYLVMELVEGEPITEYCEKRGLGVRERVELMRRVCDAVHHAHQNLVVHRDLKPGNILVTPAGEPRLLDFGIAKILEGDVRAGEGLGEEAVHTEVGGELLTPSYASPEQFLGKPVTTASDVYSLGVVLYEVLAGERPYGLARLTRAEAMRTVCEVEPPRPSASGRAREDRRLSRLLAGDLDTIVMMALRKEPQRRYASAEQLAEDLGRYFDGRPVMARPSTAAYRVSRFVGRNRGLTAAGAGLVLSLVGGIAATSWQASAAATARDAASLKAAESAAVAGFFEKIVRSLNPMDRAIGSEGEVPPTPTEALLSGIAAVQDLEDQPLVQARVQVLLGQALRGQGRAAEALPLLREALATREGVLGEHPDTLEAMDALGAVLTDLGPTDPALLEEAEPVLRSALEMREQMLGPDARETIRTAAHLARVYRATNRFDEAAALTRLAIERARGALGEADEETLEIRNNLAVYLWGQGDLDGAEGLLREVVAAYEANLPPGHAGLLQAKVNLGTVLRVRRGWAEAERLFTEVLEARRGMFQESHPEVVLAMDRLGNLWRSMKRYGDAAGMLEAALRAELANPADGDPHLHGIRSHIGQLLEDQGRLAEAAEVLREAVDGARAHFGAATPEAAVAANKLADVLMKQGRVAEAEPLLREALGASIKVYLDDHHTTANFRSDYGECLTKLGRYAEAERELLAAYPVLLKRLGEGNGRTAAAARRLVSLYEAMGRPEEAEAWRAAATVRRGQ